MQPANPALSLDILKMQQSLSSNAPPAVAPPPSTIQGISGGQLAGVIVGTLIGGLIIGVLATLAAVRVHKARYACSKLRATKCIARQQRALVCLSIREAIQHVGDM